eukprot:6492046-Amphidinium_carterae.2
MDMASLLSFEAHNLLVARYTDDIVRDPIEDRTLGKLSSPDAAYSCDAPFKTLLESPEFGRHLLSLPAPASAKASSAVKREYSAPPEPTHKRQKGKGKGKGKPRGLPLPAALLEKGAVMTKTSRGERMCYSFNLDKCTETGVACKNGRHACMKCGADGHSLSFHK